MDSLALSLSLGSSAASRRRPSSAPGRRKDGGSVPSRSLLQPTPPKNERNSSWSHLSNFLRVCGHADQKHGGQLKDPRTRVPSLFDSSPIIPSMKMKIIYHSGPTLKSHSAQLNPRDPRAPQCIPPTSLPLLKKTPGLNTLLCPQSTSSPRPRDDPRH